MQAIESYLAKMVDAQTIHPTMTVPLAVRFATISQAAELRPVFSIAALRDLKFKAQDRNNSRGETIRGNGTGAAGVWVQIGAKVLVDLAALDRWIESHRLGAVNTLEFTRAKTIIADTVKPPFSPKRRGGK